MQEDEMQAAAAGFLVVWVFVLLISGFVTGLVGYLVGRDKGRGTSGFWLGFFLSLIGIIIVAVLEPTVEVQRRRRASVPVAPTARGSEPSAQDRQRYIAEALRRDPTLGQSQDPETLRRLGEAAEQIAAEERVKNDLNALQLEADRAAQRARTQKMIEELEAEERAKEEARRTREREHARLLAEEQQRRLEAMSPVGRWLAQHRTMAIGAVVAVVIGAAVAASFLIMQRQEQVRIQEAQEAREALLESCDPDKLSMDEETSPPSDVLGRWAMCPSGVVREWVAEAATLSPELVVQLRADVEPNVRYRIASRTALDEETLALLADDESTLIRTTIAEREDLPEALFLELSRDPVDGVREAIALNPKMPGAVEETLVEDPSWRIRQVLASQSDALEVLAPLSVDADIRVAGRAILMLGAKGHEDPDFRRAKYEACLRIQKKSPKAIVDGTDTRVMDLCKYDLKYPPKP